MTLLPTEDACDLQCGYTGRGLPLLQHMQFEHVPCPECGRWPGAAAAVLHRSWCPRLQPGYVYPPLEVTGC